MAYVFREVLAVKNAKNLDANVLGEIISGLPKGAEKVTLEREARDPSHHAHGSFDWDDAEAGYSWRLHQAGQIIRCVQFVPDDKPDALPIPAFVSIATGKDGGHHAYYSPTEIIGSESLQLRLMQAAKVDLLSWLRRYTSLRSISPMVEGVVQRLDAEIAAAMAAMQNDAGA